MFYIRKSSGEKQRFDLHKFRRSLFKAGANERTINSIINQIKKDKPRSTNRIHEITTELLQKKAPAVADRYNLKRALMQLGPDGYPFERYIGELFKKQGYQVEVGAIVPGACVDHEVDVIARKGKHHYMVECKFHNRIGMKSDVKVTLYVQARFEDICDAWINKEKNFEETHKPWLVSNTQFTSQAIKYGECKGMRLIGWAYPARGNLADLITKYKLFPITTLTSLSKSQKRSFLKSGLVLCKDAKAHQKTLQKLGLKPAEIKKIIAESQAVCKV